MAEERRRTMNKMGVMRKYRINFSPYSTWNIDVRSQNQIENIQKTYNSISFEITSNDIDSSIQVIASPVTSNPVRESYEGYISNSMELNSRIDWNLSKTIRFEGLKRIKTTYKLPSYNTLIAPSEWTLSGDVLTKSFSATYTQQDILMSGASSIEATQTGVYLIKNLFNYDQQTGDGSFEFSTDYHSAHAGYGAYISIGDFTPIYVNIDNQNGTWSCDARINN